MLTACRKCGAKQLVKYGFANGNQRYKCKSCGKISNDHKPRGKPQAMKDFSILLYVMFGASFRSIGRLFGVSDVCVYKWVKKYSMGLERPEISDACKVMELDEMWHFVDGKKTRFGSGKPMICWQKRLWPGSLGSVIIER